MLPVSFLYMPGSAISVQRSTIVEWMFAVQMKEFCPLFISYNLAPEPGWFHVF